MAATGADFYEILGVDRGATAEEIKSAFRKRAMEFHPDRNPNADAAEKFKVVGRAYEVLSDDQKRARYDQYGEAGVGPSTGFEGFDFGGFGDIFDAFFGGRRTRRGPTRGEDLRVRQSLRFEEAIFGTEKEVRVSRLEHCSVCGGSGAEPGTERQTCPQCDGSGEIRRAQRSVFGQFVNVMVCDRCDGEGSIITDPCRHCAGVGREQRNRRLKVKIPGGVDDGSQMRLMGEGDAGMSGGPNGNLYVQLEVRPHEIFERDGDDLLTALPINVAQAALGLHVDVPTLDDEPEPLDIPAGTQHNDAFRIRNKGVPHLQGRGRGDLVVRVAVRVPRKLNKEQTALFEQLGEALGGAAGGNGRDRLFSRLKDAFTA